MDNQQATQWELGWLSGMLEGDGHIGIRYSRVGTANPKRYFLTNIEFTNTDKVIIEKVYDICLKLGTKMHIKLNKELKGKAHRRKCVFECRTHRMSGVEPILKAVLPYLVGEKRQRAELVLKFIELRKAQHSNRGVGSGKTIPYTREEIEVVYSVKQLINPWKSSEAIRAELREAIPIDQDRVHIHTKV